MLTFSLITCIIILLIVYFILRSLPTKSGQQGGAGGVEELLDEYAV